ncbi:DMT family transporter [soil metagenome]
MSRKGWLLFASMCVIWGLPYLFIRIAVEYLTPGTLVFLRTGLAAVILLPIALSRSQLAPVVRRWRWLLVFAVIEIITPWLLLSDAERHLKSSLAGLLVAAVPLIGALAVRLSPGREQVSRAQFVGLGIGLVGVAALVGLDLSQLNILAVLEMIVVAICYATGPIILSRTLSDLPGLGVISAALTVSCVAMVPFAVLQPPDLSRTSVLSSVLVLSVVCTALAFILFFALIATIGPTRATVITYVNPAVAIGLGLLVLGERLTAGMLVGFPLILIGSVLATRAGANSTGAAETAGVAVAGDVAAVAGTGKPGRAAG